MSDTTRDELLELTRLFSAHAAWQRELGATDVPSRGAMPDVSAYVSAGTTSAQPAAPPVVAHAAPPVVAPPVAAPMALPPVVAAPVVAPPVAAPPVVAPPVAARSPIPPAPSAAPSVPRAVEIPPVARPEGIALSLFGDAPKAAATVLKGPAVEGEERVQRLAVVADEVRGCQSCRLGKTRKNTVFSRGNPFARLFFIGEGPGEQEDLTGLPFVGPAGQLLDKIITRGMGLDAERDVYVGNIVKCRPPNNRVPESDEMTACTPFLVRQLDLVRPDVIVALGRTAVSFLLDTKDSMTKLRGKWRSYHGIAVMPTWHPSYLLRSPEYKGETWADMKLVLERLGLPVPGKAAQ